MDSDDIEETSLDEEINEDEMMTKDDDIAPPNLEDLEIEDNESGSNMSAKMIFDAFLSKVAKSNWVDWKITLLKAFKNILLLLHNRVNDTFKFLNLKLKTWLKVKKYFVRLKRHKLFQISLWNTLISLCSTISYIKRKKKLPIISAYWLSATFFLSKLPNCVNREMIDSAATEFCMQFNTKNNRKKLVKCLYSVHRNRQDLLPFYARMVATLNPCMPDIAVQLGQYLKQEFRWQLRKKDQMKIESKLKVCRFVGELVKFQMFPKSEALFCLKQLLVSTYAFAIWEWNHCIYEWLFLFFYIWDFTRYF